MCDQCQRFEQLVERARNENNPEKERVMRRLHSKHLEFQHGQKPVVAVIEPDRIIWPNGTRWIVR